MNEKVETGDFVVPGDFLATPQEFIPSEGVYEEENGVYSSRTGIVLKDADSKEISVHPKTSIPPVFKEGDIVIGRIGRIRGQIANVEIGAIRGSEDREIPYIEEAIIHISKISDEYVDDIEDELKPGDIVRARVTGVAENSLRLSIVDTSLGVLVALCSKCRAVLEREDSDLKCPECGNVEGRKLANDYRQGIL
ncbi:MAG: exosome complex RNA-binding protein Csl4 [Candidatus Hadarchaeia archaeon]